MINHIRTLLLNQSGTVGQGPDFPGEEYVPATYRARKLTPGLTACRRAIFGSDPDRLCLNYRLWQLMPLLHSTELVEYTLAPDDRVTYLRDTDPFVAFGTQIDVRHGDPQSLTTQGVAQCDEGRGTYQHRWLVTVTGTQLTAARQVPPGSTTTTALTFANHRSGPVLLPGSTLSVCVLDTGDGAWTVTARPRPTTSLAGIITRAKQAAGPHLTELFGSPLKPPFAALSSIYQQHSLAMYQLSALLLAMAYRTELLPVREG